MHEPAGAELRAQPREVRRAPLSFPQQRFWLLEQITPSGAAYNLAIALHVLGPLNVAALQQALSEIVRRHEVLRTGFASDDELQGAQVVFEPAPLDLPVLDIGSLSSAERAQECARLCSAQTQRPFNLYMPPLFRAALIRNSPDDHVLVITAYHAVIDGWSLSRLLPAELQALYAAFVQGMPSPLAPLSVQYADYASRQREHLQGAALEKRLQFWRQYLHGCSQLDMPTDRPRPAQRSFRGRMYSFQFTKEMYGRVQQLCRAEGVTIFMVLLAALDVVLARWAGQSDLVIGCPVAGRTQRHTLEMLGMFVNMLPIRLDMSGDPSFRTLLHRLRERALSAYAHQDIPLERIVSDLRVQRDLSRQALFEVTFNWDGGDRHALDLPGLTVTPLDFERAWAPFDMSWHVSEQEGQLRGCIEYATDVFEAATVERLTQSYQQVLRVVTEDASLPMSRLSLLSETDRHRQLVEWNATAREHERDWCIHELFEEQVERSPQTVAVVYEGQRLTYGELNRRSNQLAHYLREQGVQPDTLVGICLERGLEMIVGLLGILKAGGAYVPLDPSFPKERLQYMVEDGAPGIVLTQERLKGLLAETATRLVPLDGLWSEVARCSEENIRCGDVGLNSRHLAYVIYTSGSTGQPKGVMVEHAAVVNILSCLQRELAVAAADCWLAVTTISFDIAALEIYLPLVCGAKLLVASRQVAHDARELRGVIEEQAVTVLQATPAMWQMLLDDGWSGRAGLKGLCGGEALSHVLSRELGSRVSALWNMYGPTETTIWSCVHRIEEVGELVGVIEPIGRPIWNTQVYVLDGGDQPVPVGVAGEVCIGGAGVARGYLNRPELTAQRFIRDPFSADGTARLYRTGDLGRWRADGTLEYLGRNDHQVKIRGYRIELGEIEAALLTHPAVGQAAVLARGEAPGQKRLVAYVAGRSSGAGVAASAAGEFREYLRSRLPEYMVPGQFVFLEQLPLNGSGKIDRRALPEPGEQVANKVLPRSPLERQIAGIWQEMLGIEAVGVTQSFLDLGGDSLTGIRVISRIRATFRVNLTPAALLGLNSTIEALSRDIVRAMAQKHSAAGSLQSITELRLETPRRIVPGPLASG